MGVWLGVSSSTANLSGEMAASMRFPPGCAVDSGVAMAAERWYDACASTQGNLRASFMAVSSLLAEGARGWPYNRQARMARLEHQRFFDFVRREPPLGRDLAATRQRLETPLVS